VICRGCGLSSVKDEPVARDGFVIDPIGDATWRGKRIALSMTDRILLHSLAASPRAISHDGMVARIGDDFSGRYRSKVTVLRNAGAPNCIASVWGYGYRWQVDQGVPGVSNGPVIR
jgi:DNA-binding response OmpR family regulator